MKLTGSLAAAAVILIAACSTLTLQPANFAWPIESVLTIDDEGDITENRYSIEFNTIGLFYEEFKDSSSYNGKKIRMIRDNQGYYYITAPRFKNVYVFRAYDGAMVLNNKILVSESGLQNPAFNQRTPYIELIDGEKTLKLTHQGIEGEGR